jgi:polar amino acid transport system permease protein
MGPSPTVRRVRRPQSYYIGAGIFFLMLAAVTGFIYYSTLKIDYVWRWYRVPQYFLYHETIEKRAEINGTVQRISREAETITVVVSGDDGTESYTSPAADIRVSEGDVIYSGDVLTIHKKWKAGILVQGMWMTLKVSVIAIIFGIVIGLFTGLARLSDNPALKWSAVTYIELIRGSPLLVQIFIWYFAFGTLFNTLIAKNEGLQNILRGLLGSTQIVQIPPLWFGVAALAFFTGAYVAEMVRAGIQSIHRGQTEAARSLGMTYAQGMVHVILPQALRRVIPPLAGQFISLIKDSSLLGIIAIRELTKATREVVTTSFQPFELWTICALLYLFLTFTLSMALQYVERRTITS